MYFQTIYLCGKRSMKDQIDRIKSKEEAIEFIKKNIDNYEPDQEFKQGLRNSDIIPIYSFFYGYYERRENMLPSTYGNIIIAHLDDAKTCCEAYFMKSDGSYYIVNEVMSEFNNYRILKYTIHYLYDPLDISLYYQEKTKEELEALPRLYSISSTLCTTIKKLEDVAEKLFELSNNHNLCNMMRSISVGDIIEIDDTKYLVKGFGYDVIN